jgi:hypothetical protein
MFEGGGLSGIHLSRIRKHSSSKGALLLLGITFAARCTLCMTHDFS